MLGTSVNSNNVRSTSLPQDNLFSYIPIVDNKVAYVPAHNELERIRYFSADDCTTQTDPQLE